jgi:hypothetical protein
MKSSRSERPPVIRKLAHGTSESRDTSLFGRLIEQQIRASRAYSETSIEKPNVARILNRRVPPIARLTRYIE